MSGEYEKAITIEKAISQIVERRYLLPAIQRKFTWSSSQICVLFDSIMRGYPINTFMFWEIEKDSEVRKNFRFYQFLEQYCERFGENNPDFDLKGHDGANDLLFEVRRERGKGSHITLYYADRHTILRNPKDELKTGTYHAMLKQLRIDKSEI